MGWRDGVLILFTNKVPNTNGCKVNRSTSTKVTWRRAAKRQLIRYIDMFLIYFYLLLFGIPIIFRVFLFLIWFVSICFGGRATQKKNWANYYLLFNRLNIESEQIGWCGLAVFAPRRVSRLRRQIRQQLPDSKMKLKNSM